MSPGALASQRRDNTDPDGLVVLLSTTCVLHGIKRGGEGEGGVMGFVAPART